MMKGKDKGMGKGMGLLIGIGKPKGGEHEMGDGSTMSDEDMPDEDDARELKVTAARAFLSAVKGNDPEAMVDAWDAYMEC